MSEKEKFAAYNLRNIYERITPYNGVFLSVDALDFISKSSGAPSPRMKIRLCKFEPQAESQTPDAALPSFKIQNEISVYIPIGKFLVLAHNVLGGYYASKIRASSKASPQTVVTLFEHYGGTYGQSVSSIKFALTSSTSDKMMFAFRASRGEGELNRFGGITPKANKSKDIESIAISMPNDEIKEFCLIGKAYIEQYIAMDLQYRLGAVRTQRDAYTQQSSG